MSLCVVGGVTVVLVYCWRDSVCPYLLLAGLPLSLSIVGETLYVLIYCWRGYHCLCLLLEGLCMSLFIAGGAIIVLVYSYRESVCLYVLLAGLPLSLFIATWDAIILVCWRRSSHWPRLLLTWLHLFVCFVFSPLIWSGVVIVYCNWDCWYQCLLGQGPPLPVVTVSGDAIVHACCELRSRCSCVFSLTQALSLTVRCAENDSLIVAEVVNDLAYCKRGCQCLCLLLVDLQTLARAAIKIVLAYRRLGGDRPYLLQLGMSLSNVIATGWDSVAALARSWRCCLSCLLLLCVWPTLIVSCALGKLHLLLSHSKNSLAVWRQSLWEACQSREVSLFCQQPRMNEEMYRALTGPISSGSGNKGF